MNLKIRLLWLCNLLFLTFNQAGASQDGPKKIFEQGYKQYKLLSQDTAIWQTTEGSNWLHNLVALERLAIICLPQLWSRMVAVEQARFIEALRLALGKKLNVELRRIDNKGLPLIRFVQSRIEGHIAYLEIQILGDTSSKNATMVLLNEGNHWRLLNLKWDETTLQRELASFSNSVLKKYSVPSLIAELAEADHVVLEDFQDDEIGKLPRDWKWRDGDRHKVKPYQVMQEHNNQFLRAEDEGQSVILGKEIRWNIKKYPFITWRWRVRAIPKGADERYDKKADSAAGVYLTYSKDVAGVPKSVKFVWSSTLPVGAAVRRSGIGRPWNVVVGNGNQNLGTWQSYVIDAEEAYRKTFGGEPPQDVIGVGVLSDANSTTSTAFADYDDIIVLKEAKPTHNVSQILKAE